MIKEWFNKRKTEREYYEKLYKLENDRNYIARLLARLPFVYNAAKKIPNNKVIFLKWREYTIPVDAEYFIDIIAYSEGTCKSVLTVNRESITNLKKEYDANN